MSSDSNSSNECESSDSDNSGLESSSEDSMVAWEAMLAKIKAKIKKKKKKKKKGGSGRTEEESKREKSGKRKRKTKKEKSLISEEELLPKRKKKRRFEKKVPPLTKIPSPLNRWLAAFPVEEVSPLFFFMWFLFVVVCCFVFTSLHWFVFIGRWCWFLRWFYRHCC